MAYFQFQSTPLHINLQTYSLMAETDSQDAH